MLSKHPAWNWMKFIHSKKMFFSALFSLVSRSRFQVFSSPLACVYIACLDSSAKKRKTRNKMWKISISNQDSTCFLPLSAALNLLKTHSSTKFFCSSFHSLPPQYLFSYRIAKVAMVMRWVRISPHTQAWHEKPVNYIRVFVAVSIIEYW